MKKIMFLGVSLLTVGVLAACSTITTPTKKDTSAKTEQSTTESSSEAKETTYKVGDTIVFKDVAEITITNVAWTDERNSASDIVANKVLLVTYNLTNLTDDDYVVGEDIDLYVNNKSTESYPVGTILETIAAGRSIEGAAAAFAVNEDGTAELEVEPGFQINSKLKPAVVSIELPK